MKYWHIFTMSLARQFAYRTNFFFGRLQHLLILLLLYFVWKAVGATGRFPGLSDTDLISYIFMVHILRGFIFGTGSSLFAEEINNGIFSTYLIKPINHFWFQYARELADKIVLLVVGLAEVFLISWFTTPLTGTFSMTFFVLIILAHISYSLLTYLVHLVAFWSHEAMGPRFLFNWLAEFTSGAYFPLSLAGGLPGAVLGHLPFRYLLYVPILAFLNKLSAEDILPTILIQLGWIFLAAGLARIIFERGLKKYTGEGI